MNKFVKVLSIAAFLGTAVVGTTGCAKKVKDVKAASKVLNKALDNTKDRYLNVLNEKGFSLKANLYLNEVYSSSTTDLEGTVYNSVFNTDIKGDFEVSINTQELKKVASKEISYKEANNPISVYTNTSFSEKSEVNGEKNDETIALSTLYINEKTAYTRYEDEEGTVTKEKFTFSEEDYANADAILQSDIFDEVQKINCSSILDLLKSSGDESLEIIAAVIETIPETFDDDLLSWISGEKDSETFFTEVKDLIFTTIPEEDKVEFNQTVTMIKPMIVSAMDIFQKDINILFTISGTAAKLSIKTSDEHLVKFVDEVIADAKKDQNLKSFFETPIMVTEEGSVTIDDLVNEAKKSIPDYATNLTLGIKKNFINYVDLKGSANYSSDESSSKAEFGFTLETKFETSSVTAMADLDSYQNI